MSKPSGIAAVLNDPAILHHGTKPTAAKAPSKAPKLASVPPPPSPTTATHTAKKTTSTTYASVSKTSTATTGTNTSPKNRKKNAEVSPAKSASYNKKKGVKVSESDSDEVEEEFDFKDFNNTGGNMTRGGSSFSTTSSTITVTEANARRSGGSVKAKKTSSGSQPVPSQERAMYSYQHLNGKVVTANGGQQGRSSSKPSKSVKVEKASRRHETRSPGNIIVDDIKSFFQYSLICIKNQPEALNAENVKKTNGQMRKPKKSRTTLTFKPPLPCLTRARCLQTFANQT
jgi:hypothetical protein